MVNPLIVSKFSELLRRHASVDPDDIPILVFIIGDFKSKPLGSFSDNRVSAVKHIDIEFLFSIKLNSFLMFYGFFGSFFNNFFV